ncbi:MULTISPECIES: amidophosphoribosyltransferase [Pseudoalteromonas]|uniref:Amidophosphoribosyltransferase n=1 Tax=Pseudoalteromonas ruthenica TaxID=151081 RepID=A0A0F4Q0E5_9GAMM|nr:MULTISPECIES: amidophosphoribosyltransferase [Pseudoalteromonas]KJZ00751.1 amidophosphoribosyltransferase [Pseudoalteromonas ruthenica]KJZ01196.1 amidophosphoribosyltransferase [Pseudoalteromonas ruthenica]MCG7543101.1 amidophosphoribosyltransferase [Pseudoalteromonas sp. MM17-2]MCG7566810.1 amidophosphoribosyltransferase [Pseudoalteromonas sp. CnMc7-15]MCG7571244.1 amidophosphoribosyltransferase [Pseudoalteromonas sp. CNC9-20]|tara:strand:- start:389 stop:1918 length:1530 start_codon:yes stop_codon:yes gene_type:complete
MCGIVGIVGTSPVNQALYDGLTVLQHRGQDAAGIITIDNNTFSLRKANGLVKDVFHTRHMKRLQGNIGIGHVRYPTAGTSSSAEAQPFYVNSPFGIAMAHNGNLTNAEQLKEQLFTEARRHVNTTSDSEILLNILAHEFSKSDKLHLAPEDIFAAVSEVNSKVVGGYATMAMIIGHGIVAFRDPHGIRPLIFGKRETEKGTEYMFSSESVALDTDGFEVIRDVAPGEAIYVTEDGQLYSQLCADKSVQNPCLFEFVYFARPDSTIDNMSVYATRVNMGTKLGEKINREWADKDIDVVIPIPETSCDIALEIASVLDLPYRQGFVKNRYIGRTFIMPGQELRKKSVRRKLNAIDREFKGKNVLLVDDSIVRGTTSAQIVEMAREAGAKNVYFASAAPEVRFPNVYGIDMPSAAELIAHGREVEDINASIGADGLIYQSLDDLVAAVAQENPEISRFETSVFDGNYVTGDINQDYLNRIDELRNDAAKSVREQAMSSSLELHNQDSDSQDD